MGDIALRRPAGHTGARPGLASSPLPPQEGSKDFMSYHCQIVAHHQLISFLLVLLIV